MRYEIIHTPSGWLIFDRLFRTVARCCATAAEAAVLVEAFNEEM
jgi:hypothetical protein